MTRETFLHQLKIRLSQLPAGEIDKRLDYYNEIIDDMVEDGISEEEAVESFGDVDEIAQKIMQEVPLAALMKSKVTPKKGWSPAAVAIAVIGAPLWIPLAAAFVMVIGAVYLTVWSAIAALFAGVVSLGLGGGYLFVLGFTMFRYGFANVILTLGVGLCLMGLCLLGFLGAKAVSTELIRLTKWIWLQVKSLFIKKPAEGEVA